MADYKFKLSKEGVIELLKSEEMSDVCYRYASKVAAIAGDGYEADRYAGKSRVNSSVRATTPKAYYSNLKHNTLLKALGEGHD
jgi:hypothetical protein